MVHLIVRLIQVFPLSKLIHQHSRKPQLTKSDHFSSSPSSNITRASSTTRCAFSHSSRVRLISFCFFNDFLRFILIVPKTRLSHNIIQSGNFLPFLVNVKDTPHLLYPFIKSFNFIFYFSNFHSALP